MTTNPIVRDLEIRTATLEAAIRELLDATTDSRRLEAGVERLADESRGLTELLTRVDHQQQALAGIRKQVQTLDAEAAKEVLVTAQIETERRQRRHMAWFGLAGLLATLGVVFYVSDSAYDSCVFRQQGVRAQINVLESFKQGVGPLDVRLTEGQEQLRKTIAVSCEEQYPLHLG